MAYLLPTVPVFQPSHLEGDPSLATEILPGPPTLSSVQAQHAAQKKDPKRVPIMYSYLPPSDPGSTYCGVMHGTVIGQEAAEASGLKRLRADKSSATSRAQRASARGQNGSSGNGHISSIVDAVNDLASTVPLTATNDVTMVPDDESSLSHSNSTHNAAEMNSTSINGRSRRKDKGKGKEIDSGVVRIKEEPKPVSLYSPEPQPLMHQSFNDEHCSACRSTGSLVYCDGCPRAFHLWCLDPPMETIDVEKWFCPSCSPRKSSPRYPLPDWIAPACRLLDSSMPGEFQLPEDIRSFFKDVSTGPRGSYVDTSELRPPRQNRLGQPDDRDAHRLKDRNGHPITCFRCGMSALPESVAASTSTAKRARRSTARAAQYEMWKNMLSCDYCDLHWHLDCLDPPLATMPSFSKKWMCPNHAEKTLPSKRRIPKQHAAPIEITRAGKFNNGNIDIIRPEPPAHQDEKMNIDEVLINGRRYRVPERIILLDFGNKVGKNIEAGLCLPSESRASSPLTSLSSLEEPEERSEYPETLPYDLDDYDVAEMLCNLQLGQPGWKKTRVHASVQTDDSSTPHKMSILLNMSRSEVSSPAKRIPRRNHELPVLPSPSPSKRRRTAPGPSTPSEQSNRELRSKNKTSDIANETFGDPESASALVTAPLASSTSAATSKVRVKMEESEISLPHTNGLNGDLTTPKARGRGRPRKYPPKEANGVPEKPKRGRKRKERDDDLPYIDGGLEKAVKKKDSISKVDLSQADNDKTVLRTPTRSVTTASLPSSLTSSSIVATQSPATPSLKIRLPGRLSTKKLSAASQSNTATPSRP